MAPVAHWITLYLSIIRFSFDIQDYQVGSITVITAGIARRLAIVGAMIQSGHLLKRGAVKLAQSCAFKLAVSAMCLSTIIMSSSNSV